jgi:hypothetical protein
VCRVISGGLAFTDTYYVLVNKHTRQEGTKDELGTLGVLRGVHRAGKSETINLKILMAAMVGV